jgi:protein O-GlcNAc transferase
MSSPQQRPGQIARQTTDLFSQAVGFHQAGRLDEAEQLYNRVLSADKRNFDVLHLLGMLEAQRGNLDKAQQLLSNALKLKPNSAEVLINLGNVLKLQDRLDDALEAYAKALKIEPNAILALNNRGSVLSALQRFDEARASFDAALKIKHDYADALYNRGNLLIKSDRVAEALADLDKARVVQPNDPQILLARGNALLLARFDEAIAELNRALAIQPGFAEALFSLGSARQDRLSEALVSYDRALQLRPDYAEALANRGATLHALRRHGEALADYDRALALKPGLIDAWIGRGDVLFEATRYSDAFAAYDRASAINPDAHYLEGKRLCAKLMTCNWVDWEAEVSHFALTTRRGAPAHPFHLLPIATSAADQLTCANRFVADQPLPSYAPLWRGEIYSHDRIRVAYLSSDLREHAVGHLTAGLFEQHDRLRFELTAISFGPEKDSEIRRRIKNAFKHFIEARSYTDREIAELVRQREIDIAVDLNGFAQYSRTNVFASRAAPIQVNYLGYPATMGADYIDYIIVDQFVIPEDQQQHYQEKMIYMPDCFR